jgi:nucleoside-diphosphate-sugar epimerase
MKFLVTGVAGFIGSHVAERLVARGYEVVGLDNLSTGRLANLAGFDDEIIFRRGDIRDIESCRRAIRGCTHVLHLAARGSVPRSVDHPLETNDVNVGGTLNMLVAARDEGVESFVYASSSSVYGDSGELPQHEDLPLAPKSPYATSKAAAEGYVRNFAELYGMNAVSLRYFNVFGARQDPGGAYARVIPAFVRCFLAGQSPTVHWDGHQSRDFTHVDDVVEANLAAATTRHSAAGDAFNIARGEATTIIDIYRALAASVGSDLSPCFEPRRAGDVRHTLADISKARDLLDYSPDRDIEGALEATARWYAEHPGYFDHNELKSAAG